MVVCYTHQREHTLGVQPTEVYQIISGGLTLLAVFNENQFAHQRSVMQACLTTLTLVFRGGTSVSWC
jgi:hypothetical protein